MSDQKQNMHKKGPWGHIIRGMWRTPLGLIGVGLTVISATLMMLGLACELLGLIENQYVSILIFMILPGGMITGLILIPVAAYLRRRQWHKYGIAREHLQINLSDHRHRKIVIIFVILTVINFSILTVIGYEAYHFSDSPYFCGQVCHQVMEPEYTVYKRSPHAKVVCVECHIGPGADWFVRAKISGMRQVLAVITNSYSRPIPAPVAHLRPARDTCEGCHWPEKFSGKRVKVFTHFSNKDQKKPEVTEISLHIGGRNPVSNAFEGIHWHVSENVQIKYLAADAKKTQIAKVKVKRADGSEDEFVKSGIEANENDEHSWRIMDCIDCHNRPTHIYDLPEERVDFGLQSHKLNSDIAGIREDSLKVLTMEYAAQADAKASMTDNLMKLQVARNGQPFVDSHRADLIKASEYLIETYMGNVWPEMNIKWGTYGKHLGHQRADEGYGCFRCHDEEHLNKAGKAISQDCSLCHDEPK